MDFGGTVILDSVIWGSTKREREISKSSRERRNKVMWGADNRDKEFVYLFCSFSAAGTVQFNMARNIFSNIFFRSFLFTSPKILSRASEELIAIWPTDTSTVSFFFVIGNGLCFRIKSYVFLPSLFAQNGGVGKERERENENHSQHGRHREKEQSD